MNIYYLYEVIMRKDVEFMIKNIHDFKELPTELELIVSNINARSVIQHLIVRVADGEKMQSQQMRHDIQEYVKQQFRLGRLNNGDYASVCSIDGETVKINAQFNEEQFEFLLNYAANEILIGAMSEMQFRNIENAHQINFET